MTDAATRALVDGIAERAAAASPIWARHVRPPADRDRRAPFGPLAGAALATGLETIYEGYLLHGGAGRAFRPEDREQGLLLGDHLYATGLVDVCATGDVGAIQALALLIALAAHLRADPGGTADGDDGRLWLATARHLGGPRTSALGEACEALRTGDPEPLRRLVDDPAARDLLDVHRELASA